MRTDRDKKDASTRERILASAREQFLTVGYQAAAIRKIAANAGFTPGALYGYYGSKEELFYALTDPLIGRIMDKLDEIEKGMMEIPKKERLLKMSSVFYAKIPGLVDLIFEDREIVDLVLNGSKGTKYEHFLNDLVSRDVHAISEAASVTGKDALQLPEAELMQILMEGYMATLFHLITSGRDKQTVVQGMETFGRIYEAGMIHLMKENRTQGKKKQ